MLTPQTYAWPDAVSAVVVAAALLTMPGVVTALLVGARLGLAAAVGPALSTAVVVTGGSVAAATGRPWTAGALGVSVGAAWVVAAAVGLLVRARARRGPRASPEGDVAGRGAGATAGEGPRWLQATGVAAGLAVAASVVGYVLLRSSGSPEEFPEHPDTMFHLGVTQFMASHADVSFQHGLQFTGVESNAGYPVGFHSLAASVSLLTGVPAVVAVSCLVLALGALTWPLGMSVLGRTLFGATPAVGATTAVTSVLFVAFPFMLMGFGTIWPNLFGQALLPGVVAAAVTLTGRLAPLPAPASEPLPTLLVLVPAVLGLAVAHPNAVITAALFGVLALWVAALRHGLDKAGRGLRRWAPFAAASTLVIGGALGSLLVAPGTMSATGAPGPEMTLAEAIQDTIGFAPRVAEPVAFLGVLVVVGAVITLLRFPAAAWLVIASGFLTLLYVLNTAVDTPTARILTWPWYNNAIRLAAVAILPAALLAAAAILGPSRWLGERVRPGWSGESLVAALVLSLVVLPSNAWAGRDVAWLRPYFHPGQARSWANPTELQSLHELAALLPPRAVVAADPWKGGTYMYVVGGTDMYYRTEKLNVTPESRAVGLGLADVGRDPEMCRMVQEAGITHALVGGVPFLWGGSRSERQFVGIERVATSPAWEEVATREPYTLYRLVECAGRDGS